MRAGWSRDSGWKPTAGSTGQPDPANSWIVEQAAVESRQLRDELRREGLVADAIGAVIAIIVLPLIIRPYVSVRTLAIWTTLLVANYVFGYFTYALNLGSEATRHRTNQIWHIGIAAVFAAVPWLAMEMRADFGAAMTATVLIIATVASDSLYLPQTVNTVWRPFTAAPAVSLALAHLVTGRWPLALGIVGLTAHLLGGASSISKLVNQLVGQRVQSEANEKQANEAAMLDSLTGLLSRRGIQSRIEELMLAGPERVACAVVDVDDFKQINDLWGHEVGDQTLIAVAAQVRAGLPDWHLSRLSGDEFLAVAEGPLTPAREQQLRSLTVSSLIPSSGDPSAGAPCRVSVGATSVPAANMTITRLFGEASAALHQAKQLGKAQLVVMDEQLLTDYENLIRLGGPVGDAIRDGEIQPFGQTIVDMRTGDIVGVELLARWLRPNGQIEMPGVFVPVIEHRGLADALGDSMLDAAARFAADLRAAGSTAYVSMNISASHLASTNLLPRVTEVLHAHECPPDALLIEVTESQNLADLRGWGENAERLRKLGIGLAIDDFGTGYSSISQLLELPFSHLKVDRTIIQQVSDGSTRSLLLGLRKFAENAGITLVAEGVELESERDRLLELGISVCQGFLYSRPVTLAAVFEMVEDQTLPPELDPRDPHPQDEQASRIAS